MRRGQMGHVLKTGAIVGSLVGVLCSVLVIGWLWFTDAKEGTDYAAKMAGPVLLVCLCGSAISIMLVYAIRYARVDLAEVLQQNHVVEADEWEPIGNEGVPQPPYEERWDEVQTGQDYRESLEDSPVIDAIQPDAQLKAIIECVIDQLTAYYQYETNPSRKLFEDNGIPQPIWNTARGILKRAGWVDDSGKQWAMLPWEVVRGMLKRVRPEGDNRIWMPPVRGNGLVNVNISSQLQAGNTYLVPLPH